MKKQIFILMIFAASLILFIPEKALPQGMEVGKNNFGIGLGLGNNWYRVGGIVPAIRANFDHGFFEAGPGIISLGGSAGISYCTYDNFLGQGYNQSWTNVVIASRGAWHYNFGNIGNENFNAYGGAGIGIRLEFYKNNYNGSTVIVDDYGGPIPHFSTFIGGSYQFSESLGIFTELGYDVTNVLFGLNFRF